MPTLTGASTPGSSMITPGPMNARESVVMPPIVEEAVNVVCAPSKLTPPTRWLLKPKHALRVGCLDGGAIAVGVRGLAFNVE